MAPYLTYLDEKSSGESQILALFKEAMDAITGESEADEMRKARIHMNMLKMESMLGFLGDGEVDQIKAIEQVYNQFVSLDGKPMKGERKMADDLVLVLN